MCCATCLLFKGSSGGPFPATHFPKKNLLKVLLLEEIFRCKKNLLEKFVLQFFLLEKLIHPTADGCSGLPLVASTPLPAPTGFSLSHSQTHESRRVLSTPSNAERQGQRDLGHRVLHSVVHRSALSDILPVAPLERAPRATGEAVPGGIAHGSGDPGAPAGGLAARALCHGVKHCTHLLLFWVCCCWLKDLHKSGGGWCAGLDGNLWHTRVQDGPGRLGKGLLSEAPGWGSIYPCTELATLGGLHSLAWDKT